VRRKWLVLIVVALGTGAGLWVGRRLGSHYLARAVLWVEVADPRDRTPDPLKSELLDATGWVDLLRSHAILDEVVRDERLYLAAAPTAIAGVLRTFQVGQAFRPGSYRLSAAKDGKTWTLATTGGTVVDHGAVGDSVGTELGFLWQPETQQADATIEFTVTSYYEVASQLAQDLRTVTELDGNFIRIELKGEDPARVAAVVNAVAKRLVLVATDLKRQKQIELARIFAEQLEHARLNLSRTEAALRTFRVGAAPLLAEGTTAGGTGRGGSDPARAGFIELRSEQEQLERDRLAIERLLTAASDSELAVDALGLIGAVQRSSELSLALRELSTRQAELRTLRFRYTDENPEVRRVANQVAALQRVTIPSMARALASELGIRRAELSRRVESATGDLRRVPALVIEDASLRRDVETAEEVFTRIQERYGEAQLAVVSSVPDVRILDVAVPPQVPLSDLGPLFGLLGFVGSLGVAVLGAATAARFDRRVQDPLQVSEQFGLRILGALPRMRAKGDGATQAIDAFRGIRMNLIHVYGSARPLVVTVSSPSASDGKSFVTSNLALAFADAGWKTLLVDGDLRQGGLHRLLAVSRKPGLTDVLSGKTPLDAALRTTGHTGLAFLASGSRTPTGPELLSSPAMTKLLVDMRGRYDAILVDSPPLAAGVEPYVLGALTANLLVVLRMGLTDGELAEAKLDALDGLPIRVLGAVLNDVRSPAAYGRYAYALEGYEVRDEKDTWAENKILRDRS
jgi:tyrosine-protein kinase Etk/Wzc